jgi:hypothetical protein
MSKNTTNESLTNNHVVGVIHGEESARQAAQELERRYPNPVVLSGEEGARQIDAKGEHGGVFSRIFSLVEDHLSESTNYLKQYEAEARNGNCVIAVEVANREEAEPVREVLERNGAHNIRFFGKLAVTDLSPETNPSIRSEDSPEKQRAT